MTRAFPLLTVAVAATPALAQNPDVAIAAAASTSLTNCSSTSPQAMLMASGLFDSVDLINVTSATPTLADLSAYDAILTWSNVSYDDAVAFGDVMADYVDSGGGVVVATFANSSVNPARSLMGRWQGTYEVIEDQSGNMSGQATLGVVHDPMHPIMAGVATFDGGPQSFRPSMTTLTGGSTLVAEWSDGTALVALGSLPGRVDLGFYPPSDLCSASFWDSSTDGDKMLSQALRFSADTAGTLGTNYCMANVNSTGSVATMSAGGSTLVADNDLTLRASSLPAHSFSFFITSLSQGFVANPSGSEGNLCLGGSIGRYVGPGQIQQANVAGEISLTIDLTLVPQPLGFVSVGPGETWNFQAWHRDTTPSGPSSNFTDGLEIAFV